MTFGPVTLPAESSGSAGSSQTSPSGTKRKLPETDPNTSFDSLDSRPSLKAGGVDKTTSSTSGGRMKQKGDRFHPLFDKTDEKDKNKNSNSTTTKGESDLGKKRRKIDLEPEDPASRHSTHSKESSSRSRSDPNYSKRKHSTSSHSHSHSHSQRQKLKSLMRPSKPTYEKEDATHLVAALKDSQEEVDRLRAELKAAKEKEDRVETELKEAKEKEDGVRMVLDRFEEELCCGICQESFIDPVTVQPCGHSYCGKCMSDWLKSYKINEKLVWTLPGHTSNLLEVTHAQRKRAGELNLTTAVHKVNIPAPPPSVKYNQWGEAYVDDEGSDSEGSEDEDQIMEDANGDAAAGAHGYHVEYDSEEDEDDDRSDRSGSHVSEDGSQNPPPAVNEGNAPPPVVVEEAVSAATEVAANETVLGDAQTPTAIAIDEVPPPIQLEEAAPVAAPDFGEAQLAAINPERPAIPVAGVADPGRPPDQAAPPRPIDPAHIAAHAAAVATILDVPALPAVVPAPGPVEIKLGDGKLSSKGLSCVFCKRTPITGIVPALALGAATELLVKARPEFAREQEAIDDHRKTYEKGQALSFPIPISATPSFVAVQKAPVRIYRDRDGEGLNERYWKPCKHCPAPGRVPGRFVCPIPVPNPNRRSTRLSRDLPCPGHVLCGRCEALTPESLAKVCDGCGESACKSCDMPLLKQLHEPHMYADYLMYPEELGNNASLYPQFAKALLVAFRHNPTEAAIFFTWAQNQSRLANAGLAPNTSYLNRPKRFSTSHVFTELSSWLSSTEGVAANGLKGLFERFGIQGGLQKPTGGTGRFCGSCGGTIFKAGLAEWWMRHSKKTAVAAVIPAAIKDRVKCKWGNTCFYQANETHAEQYSHLCARMTDEEIAALPEEQTAPTNTGAENNIAAFCKAHKSARLLFELDAAPAPVAAPPVTNNEDVPANATPANVVAAGDVPPAPVANPAADNQAQINEHPANPGSDAASQGDDHITQDEEAAWHAAVEATLSAHDDSDNIGDW